MTKPTHQLIVVGVGTTGAAVVSLGLTTTAVLTGVGAATTMWPDKLEPVLHVAHRRLTHKWWMTFLVPALFAAALIALLVYGPPALAHTGMRHPPAGMQAEAAILVGLFIAGGVLLGYVCHLAADACTVGGLRRKDGTTFHLLPRFTLPLPFGVRVPISLRVRVGKSSETVFQLVFLVSWLGGLYLLLQPELQALGGA